MGSKYQKAVTREAILYAPVIGQSIESRMIDDLELEPDARYTELQTLVNLQGEDTGFLHSYQGARIEKAISLSLNLVAGMRYFFLHVVPKPEFQAPRYSFEGVLTDQGSRVTLDLFPDTDVALNLDSVLQAYTGVRTIYEAAREDANFAFESSRIPHIRAVCSPYFLSVFSVLDRDLPKLEAYADAYFGQWLQMFAGAETLSNDEAQDKIRRRSQIETATIAGNYMSPVATELLGDDQLQAVMQAVSPTPDPGA